MAEVARAMMDEEIQVSKEAVRVSAEQLAGAEVMRVNMERQVKAERWAADKEAAQIKSERRAAAMNHPLEFSFRLYPI